MKVYVDISKQCIIKTDDEDRTVFKGDENVDHIKVYFKEMPTQWYLTLGALLPNGRTIPQRFHDGEVLTDEIDGTTYYYATFTLSKENGFTLVNGLTNFTLRIHYVNDSNVVIKEKTIGAIAVNIVESTTEDENILILDGDTAEVVYNMKLAIENMQARLTNYENSFTSNQITARALLKVLNDFSSYKVVFGHSYKEDEEDASTRKYFLMAVVNKEDNSNVIFGIDATGKVYYKNFEILNLVDKDDLENQMKDLDNNKVDKKGDVVDGLLTVNKGVEIPKNHGVINTETGDGMLFMPDGSLALNTTSKGLVLTLIKDLSNLLCREYTFPDKDGEIVLKEDFKGEVKTLDDKIKSVLELLKVDDINYETMQKVVDALKLSQKDIEALEKEFDNYYDKKAVASLISQLEAGMTVMVVDALPTENISLTTIYLIPKEDYYVEYIYVESQGKFELIGNTKIDLTDYIRKLSGNFYIENTENGISFGHIQDDGTKIGYLYDTKGTLYHNTVDGNYEVLDVGNFKNLMKLDDITLYNLGAYDTISNGVITRKTGYITINAENITGIQSNTNSSGYYPIYTNLITPSNILVSWSNQIGVSNTTFSVENINSSWIGNGEIGLYATDTIVIGVDNSTHTIDSVKAMCPIYIQYELANSYTENVIEGQPLITLDKQGSQWLREEWEKGINLGDFNDREGNYWVSIQNDITDFINSLPVGTYRISADITPLELADGYSISDCFTWIQVTGGQYIGDGVLALTYYDSLNQTKRSELLFTKQNYTNYGFYLWGIGNHNGGNHGKIKVSNIMITKGEGIYPYQPYNANKHITNYEAEFLKKEYSRGENLLDYVSLVNGTTNNNGLPTNIGELTRVVCEDFVSVKPNTTYTLNTNNGFEIYEVNYFDNDKNTISLNTISKSTYTFTTPSNCYYLTLLFRNSDNSVISPSAVKNNATFTDNATYEGEIVRSKDLTKILYKHSIHFKSTVNSNITIIATLPSATPITIDNALNYDITGCPYYNSNSILGTVVSGFYSDDEDIVIEVIGTSVDGSGSYHDWDLVYAASISDTVTEAIDE